MTLTVCTNNCCSACQKDWQLFGVQSLAHSRDILVS